LPWYSSDGSDLTAWQAFDVLDIIMLLAALAGLAVGVVAVFRISVSYPPAGSSIAAGAGAVAFLCILYRAIDPPASADLMREVGLWLGLVSSGGIAVGGWLGMQEPRERAHPSGA